MQFLIIFIFTGLTFHSGMTYNVENEIVNIKNHDTVYAASGDSFYIIIELSIKKGFKIQANKVNDSLLIPTTLTIKPVQEISIADAVFPEPKLFKMVGFDEGLLVFEDSLSIHIPIILDKSIKPGNYDLKSELYYQPCDDRKCFFPVTEDFTIHIKVLGENVAED